MSRTTHVLCSIIVLAGTAMAAVKAHVITFGKSTQVRWLAGADENTPLELKVRALYVDGKLKEFTIGSPHEITERLFVARRAFRVNDSLPDEATPRWLWQKGGWVLIDRVTGRITPLNLPEFDPYRSVASWYRDYVAYCGVSDDNQKLYALVIELGRRKPVLKKELRDAVLDDKPDSACQPPRWKRQPARVSFDPNGNEKATYLIRGHSVDVVNDEEDKEGSE
jgi:hypothetical protein